MSNQTAAAAAVFVLLLAITAPVWPLPKSAQIKWYSQKVDHFSYANGDVFKQRYIISTEHFQPNQGPIFFYCGNEGDIVNFANNTGFMWEKAAEFGAMVVFMEHRYYGESMPYGKDSYKDLAKLGYLTVEQALADYADFLVDLKKLIPGAAKSPVVSFGGSYGGMLATWFRMKYPHITIGALAASAPVLQFPGLYDCHGYYDIVTRDFRDYSAECAETIRKSWPAFDRMINSTEGLEWLTKNFHLCDPLNKDTAGTFVDYVAAVWDSLPMIDYPNPASFLQTLPAYPIKHVCEHLTKSNADDAELLQQISAAVNVYYNYTGSLQCAQIANQTSDSLGLAGWDFQSCTEMVLPICSDGKRDLFRNNPWNFTTVTEECRRKFQVSPEKFKAIIEWGGREMKSASNIIFSNGLRDPWSAGGVLETLSDTLVSIKIPGACHHEDLRAQGSNDPKPLLEARKQEVEIIKRWLEEYHKQQQSL